MDEHAEDEAHKAQAERLFHELEEARTHIHVLQAELERVREQVHEQTANEELEQLAHNSPKVRHLEVKIEEAKEKAKLFMAELEQVQGLSDENRSTLMEAAKSHSDFCIAELKRAQGVADELSEILESEQQLTEKLTSEQKGHEMELVTLRLELDEARAQNKLLQKELEVRKRQGNTDLANYGGFNFMCWTIRSNQQEVRRV